MAEWRANPKLAVEVRFPYSNHGLLREQLSQLVGDLDRA